MLFNVNVIYTADWTVIGNANGDVDALEKGFRDGGIEEVARLSREVNLQEDNVQNKQVSPLRTYQFSNGTGYGFTITESLMRCFSTGKTCGSGRVVRNPLHIVYVANGEDIYRIEFIVDSKGEQVFSTFRITE